MADTTLDIFNSSAFTVLSMTDAINKFPFIPGRAGSIVNWEEEGVATTSIMIEEIASALALVSPTPRGGPGHTAPKDRRTARNLNVPHYEIDDAIYADEVQGVRAFGQVSAVQTVVDMVNMRMNQHTRLKLDPTLEYQRVGALKGIILNGDGTTLYNLYTEFGVTQQTEVAFDLTAASPASGAVRRAAGQVTRTIASALDGLPYSGIYALCGDAFFDDLVANAEVRATYLNQSEASQLRAGYVYGAFNYAGIIWENYRGSVGGSSFINTDKCHFFPVGVPGLYRTIYAPADYVETVNTLGLPRYSRQYQLPNGKGVSLEVQMNALSYVTRPRVLVQGKRGA